MCASIDSDGPGDLSFCVRRCRGGASVSLTGFTMKMSRRTAVGVWIIGIGLAHMVLPLGVGWATRRSAFKDYPAIRLVGLASLSGGFGGLAWSLAQHYQAVPDGGYKMALTPDYLLQSGPYRLSRNPMYVAELAMWTGWALLLETPWWRPRPHCWLSECGMPSQWRRRPSQPASARTGTSTRHGRHAGSG